MELLPKERTFHFADAITQASKEKGPLIVGIDPSFSLMPAELLPATDNSIEVSKSLYRFSETVIDAVAETVVAVKFQSAYFEQCGSLGVAALAQAIAYAKSKGLLTILDAKRGDIGSTSSAYAAAYLGSKNPMAGSLHIKSDLEVDCLTINPFLGIDSITPFVDACKETGKAIFILVRTSNPSAVDLQSLEKDGKSVSQHLATEIAELGAGLIGDRGFSNIGAVVGATYPEEARILRSHMPNALILVPGTGSQGGTIETAAANFTSSGLGAIISISRAITYPDATEIAPFGFQESVARRARSFQEKLRALSSS